MEGDATLGPGPGAVQAELERIVASAVFVRSDRMARFLRHIVEAAIRGDSASLKEYSIGIEVFDKGEDFDPRIDPVVRSEARRLRQKLAEYYESQGAGDPVLIDLPKGSYAPSITLAAAPAAVPVLAPLPAVPPPPAPSRLRHWPWAAAAALVLATAGVAGVWYVGGRKAAPPAPRSVAVLPFENLSSDPENEYFSDGLTEEILNSLANVPGLKVVARTSAFQFKGKHVDVREVGRMLNVDTVLDGSVRKDGSHIRITPQLIDAATGFHLWSKEFDREFRDILDVQQEIGSAVAKVLGAELVPAPARPVDAETYGIYLQGRYYFNRWASTGFQKSIELFEQVVRRDPTYAPGYASLAPAYGLAAAFGAAPTGRQKARALGKAAANKAIELDPRLAEGWVGLAPFLAEEFDWPGAERAFQKAIEYGPNLSEAHGWYAEVYLTPQRRLDEALRESRIAVTLDPMSPYALMSLAKRFVLLRQYDDALVWSRKALDLDPTFWLTYPQLVGEYVAKNDPEAAAQLLAKAQERFPATQLAPLWARVWVARGEARKAAAVFRPIETEVGNAAACDAAGLNLALGDQAGALRWLEHAVTGPANCFQVIPADPRFDSLRGTPAFQGLLRTMRLVP